MTFSQPNKIFPKVVVKCRVVKRKNVLGKTAISISLVEFRFVKQKNILKINEFGNSINLLT